MRSICKEFPGMKALDSVDLDLERGEIHVLVGENGAGKSTLMKILSGVYRADSGEIRIEGQKVTIDSPKHAEALGISMIHQEFNLLPWRDVAQNVFLGREPTRGLLGMIDVRRVHDDTRALLKSLGISLDTHCLVRSLGVAQRQMVEVAKALSMDARILIMDEPTATLTTREIDQLFTLMRNLTSRGVGIIYISHRTEEIFRVGDRITVLRDGQRIATRRTSEVTMDELISMMVGRKVEQRFVRDLVPRGPEALRVRGLTRKGKFEDVSLSVHCGEIVGIAGLVGAGRTEVARAIFGGDPHDSGEIRLFGKAVRRCSPSSSVSNGMGLLPEDRKDQGLALIMTIKDNIVQACLRQVSDWGFINFKKERILAEDYVRDLRIAAPSIFKLAKFLSGGTQQKVVLAKWLASRSRILIFDEPTRGIDVGVKAEIYKMMNELAKQGVAILMISSDLPEIMGLCDRTYVMHEGRMVGEFGRGQASQEDILRYAMGRGETRGDDVGQA